MSKKILIVGAGITGLSLAGLLKKSDIDVTIIDRVQSLNQPGYGITVMPAGLEVIDKLGLGKKARTLGVSARNCQVIDSQGKVLKAFDLADSGVESVTTNRADLHKLLAGFVGERTIRFDTTISEWSQDKSGVNVTFSDGTHGRYDAVIATDGINSPMRTQLFPENKPEYVGAAMWAVMLPEGIELEQPETVRSYWADEKFMGIFPIDKTRASVAFSMPLSPDIRASRVRIRKVFSQISPDAARILAAVKKSDIFATQLRNIKLKHWTVGRIALAGDAAHGMLPSTGMGGSIGLQDADTIAGLLQDTPVENWARALKRYEKARKPKADAEQKQAFMIGKMMLASGIKMKLRDMTISLMPKRMLAYVAALSQ